MLDSGQRTKRVVVSSNRDVDVQLGTLKVPQARIVLVGCIREVLVQLLGDGVRDLNPRIGRVDVSRDLAAGSTRNSGIERRGDISPFDGIDDSVVRDVVVRTSVVQVGILGNEAEIREVGCLEFILGNVKDLGHVRDLADGEKTTERHVGSSVILVGADKQSPEGPTLWLSKDPSDKAIRCPVIERLIDRRSVRPDSKSRVSKFP